MAKSDSELEVRMWVDKIRKRSRWCSSDRDLWKYAMREEPMPLEVFTHVDGCHRCRELHAFFELLNHARDRINAAFHLKSETPTSTHFGPSVNLVYGTRAEHEESEARAAEFSKKLERLAS